MCKSFVGERKQGEELEHGPWGSRRSGDGGSRMVCAAWCHHGRCKEEPDSSRVKIRGKRAARTHGDSSTCMLTACRENYNYPPTQGIVGRDWVIPLLAP
ncbi:hypothetical protein Y1Q_0001312 [Alligator mississippiensis]|uniref:Uncharacterized protein n=1 Tax=Alligator mississippiensis TaxID=8496 RepID=A0A151M972_ALLMI|nr:hypothetical protein Y1Q_0001312 [Alligator mississippiensis]